MAKLPRFTLTHNEKKGRWDLTKDGATRPAASFDTKSDATKGGALESEGGLRNWRSKKIGPSFIKIGKSVLYPVNELDRWDRSNLVPCQRTRHLPFDTTDTETSVI